MICRWIRSKALYGHDGLPEASLQKLLAAQETPCSCLQTAQPWGPDERPVTPGLCTEERGCFVGRTVARA